jgi:hypothetical protein
MTVAKKTAQRTRPTQRTQPEPPKCIVCAAYKRELAKVRAQHQATKCRAKESAERVRARLAIEAPQGNEVSIKWLRFRIAQLETGRKARGGKDIGAEESAFRELLRIRLARQGET